MLRTINRLTLATAAAGVIAICGCAHAGDPAPAGTTVKSFHDRATAERAAIQLVADAYAAPSGADVCPIGARALQLPGGAGADVPLGGGRHRVTAIVMRGTSVYRISATGARTIARRAVLSAAAAVENGQRA